jgi:hypothetical protein
MNLNFQNDIFISRCTREAGTFRFRDRLNQECRFTPLWLDDATVKGSLAQFLYARHTIKAVCRFNNNQLATDKELPSC